MRAPYVEDAHTRDETSALDDEVASGSSPFGLVTIPLPVSRCDSRVSPFSLNLTLEALDAFHERYINGASTANYYEIRTTPGGSGITVAMTMSQRGYGQICPLAKASELLCERWTLLVVRELCLGSRRYAELRRGIPRISPTMLSLRLRELEDGGVVVSLRPRGAAKKGTGSVEYDLTTAGRELIGVLEQMTAWGHRWAVADLRREDMEPSYLMWVAHKTIRTQKLGPGRTVIEYRLVDAPGGHRNWWIVAKTGETELCFKHPGFEVGLTVSLTLQTMSQLLLGQLCPKEAIRRNLVQLTGAQNLQRSFSSWYPRSFDFERR